MRLSHPCLRRRWPRLAWLLGLMVLAGLPGCGPGDGPEARGTGQGVGSPEEAASPSANPASPLASNPVPLASEHGTGSASGRGTVAGGKGDSPHAVPVPFSELVIPDWMAKELDSLEVQVRLKAVETWGQSAPNGSVDPLIQALEDQDEQVQARALELIVQDWAREQAAKK